MKDVTLDLAQAFADMREAYKTKRLFIFFNTKTHQVTSSDKLSDKQLIEAIENKVIIVDTNNQQVFDYEQGWRVIESDGQVNKKKSRRTPARNRKTRSRRLAKRGHNKTSREPSDE